MKTFRKFSALLIVLATILGTAGTLISCGGSKGKISNEETRLVLSTAELDGVFNPFYSSSGPDGSVVGMTQIGMLSSDKDGKVAYGKDEACVVLDYEYEFKYDANNNITETVYRFVLKNDIKFSNGSPLTMKDVLFNLYVYLDPAYYGSATIYSTEIKGLEEYRTQSRNENEQEGFSKQFDSLADDRVARFLECYEIVKDNNKNKSLSDEEMVAQLTDAMNETIEILLSGIPEGEENEEITALADSYRTVVEDYELIKKYFKEELQTDYNYARGTAQDIAFTDAQGNKVTLTNDTEAFLYNEGYIVWLEDEYMFDNRLGDASKNWTEEEAINAIYISKVPNYVDEVVSIWNTAVEIRTYFAFLEMEKYFKELDKDDRITNISGIRYANMEQPVTVNKVVYGVPTLDENGAVVSGNEVLEITIDKVDPKAIWNFAFTVAPMYYYSDYSVYKDFNYVDNFGVEFGSIKFQDEVIKNPDKIGVPVGAGAYKATTHNGDSSNVTKGTFFDANVVHFERNEHFMFPVTIKYVNYQVVSTNLMLDALYAGDVHFVEPACKQENIDSIASRRSEGFDSTAVMTNGYGYIGINAEKVPSINVRRAIMHAINTTYATDYYLGYSHPIYRPMTKASWAYPKETDQKGQFYKFDPTGDYCEQLVKEAGYTLSGKKNSQGVYVYQKNGELLKYTFTIAGDTTDHPAYQSMKIAADILNKHGFDIEVKTDINALKKLNNGDLTVWAAAWGAGVDPDMYQVYHIDSTAGSTANWGYRAIKKNNGNKYDTEYALVRELSDIIDLARETLDEERRAAYYAEALDIVMELAVELPTYQRSDLFAYNTNIIDVNSLTPESELTPYNGPLSKIWEVSLNESGN